MRWPVLLLFLAVAALQLHAQEGLIPLDSAAITALAPLRDRIDYAARMRFKTPWGTSVLATSRLLPSGLGYDSLTNPGSHLAAPAFELQVRGRATLTGLQVGTGVLGLAGALFGSQYAELACTDTTGCVAPRFQGAVIVGLLGGAVGAVIGALVGSQFPQWRTIYRHPEASQ
jgi:hypothetical protein